MRAADRHATAWRWVYAGAWMAYGALFATALLTNGVPAALALRNAIANVLPDALLGVLVLRIPAWLDQERRSRFALRHAGLALAFLAASTLGWLAIWGLDRGLFTGVWSLRFDLRTLPFRLATGLLAYAALVGFGYARRHEARRRDLEGRLARIEASRARTELDTLRRQLDPHFVLNTLHAVLGLVRRDPATAETALERLGDLLRRSLRLQREGIDRVALREEAALVEESLALERLRLGDRLRVEIDLPETLLDAEIPSFALQTLVENAVRHGVAPRAAGGTVAVTARRAGDRLRLEVANDAPLDGAPSTNGGGVGLRLLEERLGALYDGRASLDAGIRSDRFVATLDVPLDSEEAGG